MTARLAKFARGLKSSISDIALNLCAPGRSDGCQELPSHLQGFRRDRATAGPRKRPAGIMELGR